MLSIMAGAQQIKLPARISRKLQGKKIKIEETKDGVLLKPEENMIDYGMGLFKGTRISTANFLALKARDKELEK
ncbi:MAG: hypothetical protein NTX50_14850 [Candidatus Sumerlaeota bacterium]|nr:hypothetical protein [Candidatus Sumerlaeota bacterium]